MQKPRKPLLHHLHDYFFPHERNNYRPHLFSIASVTVLVIAILVFEAGYVVQTKIVFFRTNFLASVLPGTLVTLTNQDRMTIGIAGVTENSLLDQAAQAVATDMATKSYFAHISPDGKTPWQWLDQVGYKYSYAGENLAVNFTDSQNVETAWMNSPTHRANIEKPQYSHVGFGTANGIYEGKDTTFVVEFFAAPAVISAEKTIAVGTTAAKASSLERTSTSTIPEKVLGTQTGSDSAVAPHSTGWLAFLLASPLSTLITFLTILFAVVAIPFVIVIFMRGRTQHPNVIFGGTILLIVISVTILLSIAFAGPVLLPSDTQSASVYMGLSH